MQPKSEAFVRYLKITHMKKKEQPKSKEFLKSEKNPFPYSQSKERISKKGLPTSSNYQDN